MTLQEIFTKKLSRLSKAKETVDKLGLAEDPTLAFAMGVATTVWLIMLGDVAEAVESADDTPNLG